MGSGYAKRKKQAKAMQEQFAQVQQQMKESEETGTAGNGLVTVVVNGEFQLKKVKIKPECVDPDDIEGLEDLIVAAYKDAAGKLQESGGSMGGLGDMLGGGGMPDLGGLLGQ